MMFRLDDLIMSKIIDQSIQEYEMMSPECSGHESNTNEIQMRDDGQCHKLCKMEHEDIKHSKTKENAFQDENHQLHQDDIILQEIDCLFCAIQQCYKQFTGKENLGLPGTQSINDKYEMEHEKIKVAHLQIYTIMGYSRSGSGERDRKRDASKNRKKTEKQTVQNPFTNIQNNALMPLVQELSNVRKKLEMEAVKLKIEVAKLTEEKEILLTRLSRMAGARLRDGNPFITDLGDSNRPDKLAERFSELYDNEWSDVIEKMPVNESEEHKVDILLNILKNIYTNCQEISKEQLQNLKMFGIVLEDVKVKTSDFNTGSSLERKAKEMQLLCGTLSLDRVKMKILSAEKFASKYREQYENCDVYITRCIEICWLMNMQEVPMHLDFACQRGDPFRHDLYKPFTKSGNVCGYLVWPLLSLHKDGPIMKKGVIQPLK
uniref:Uncharacterized protein LOC111122731 isoform X2 n=1 Tax=Crassostrea virginica TaxID=6565 RepID=A0A8B8D0N6_CRAVI|nr:uncharacterized protein LOC111122731 isoform X2 [Crassostrea virginica]